MLVMTSYEFGDIVLVPFPFTNQQATKKRPAVVISSVNYNINREDVIIMAVTSQIYEPLRFGEIRIAKWQEGWLLKPSVVKPIIATLEQDLIIRMLGKLDKDDRESLLKSLRQFLKL
ncbi:hypothetical protein AY600_15005 [Phormidium willei BDU 130791]|nr:hypothetical protein AY600_15005 [Phormidium willei BDU 130791]